MIANDENKYFYERFAGEFDGEMNKYDLNKRLSVVFDKLIGPDELIGKKFLDIGCGTGCFSQKAVEYGADVVSADVGSALLNKVAQKCKTKRAVLDLLSLGVKDKEFDYILATEVIEHTSNPELALTEIHRALKNNGVLIITLPNKIWHFTLHIAKALKIRKYKGYENWMGYYQLRRVFKELGFEVENMFGFHLFPFTFSLLNPVLNVLDSYSKFYSPVMLNIAARCRKIK